MKVTKMHEPTNKKKFLFSDVSREDEKPPLIINKSSHNGIEYGPQDIKSTEYDPKNYGSFDKYNIDVKSDKELFTYPFNTVRAG